MRKREYKVYDTDTYEQTTVIAKDLKEAKEKAKEWLTSGEFGDGTHTVWLHGRVEGPDGTAYITIKVDPEEPNCVDELGHDWQRPHSLLGGLKENPGVWGTSKGVSITEVCSRCGVYRTTETDHNTHEDIVSYREPDEELLIRRVED